MVSIADTLISTYELHTQYLQREEYILAEKERGNMDIVTPIYKHKYPWKANHDALAGLSDITEDSGYWINMSLAKYYGVNSVTGVN